MKMFRCTILLMLSLFLFACGEKKDDTINLSYANFAKPSTFVSVQMEHWAKEVERRTNGKVKVNTSTDSTLLSAATMYDGIVAGTADIGNVCTAYHPLRFPITNALSLPLGFTSAKMASKAMLKLFNNFSHKEFNDVEVLTLFANAPANLMSVHPIRALSDIKGMKLRATGGAADVLKTWGANQVAIAMSDIPEALQKGTIEGLFTSLEVMQDYNFAETCKFVTMTEQVVHPFVVVMNKEKFNSLPADIQKILKDLFTEQSEWTADYMDSHVKEAMEWAVREKGVEVIIPTTKTKILMDKATSSLIGSWAAEGVLQGLPTEEILATLQDYTEKHEL